MKHRRSEMTQDKQGLLAGFGGTLMGNKFHEQDEVRTIAEINPNLP
jgi:hypothetical protein